METLPESGSNASVTIETRSNPATEKRSSVRMTPRDTPRAGVTAGTPGSRMQAIVQRRYGTPDTLTLEEVAKPSPCANELLVRVKAAGVSAGNVHVLTGKPYLVRLMGYGLMRPKHRIPGMAVAGTVEAVGAKVTQFRPGDAVFGELKGGAFAEYVCAPQELLAPMPTNLTFEQAAAVPDSATTALQGLRDVGNIRAGQRVLINGASGGVGTFAVQIAKSFGAIVTGVCSTRNMDLVRTTGADAVIDYTRSDFTKCARGYDLMLDLVGNRSLLECRSILQPEGVYVAAASHGDGNWIGPLISIFAVILSSRLGSQKMAPLVAIPRKKDLLSLKTLLETGAVQPVIDRRFTLKEVPEALRYMAAGHTQGKTVVCLEGADEVPAL